MTTPQPDDTDRSKVNRLIWPNWVLTEAVATANPEECWIYAGTKNPKGYGTFSVYSEELQRYTTVMAHRIMYESCIGPIPTGMYIDHLCRVSSCINPDHLEPVTPRENVVRGNSAMLARQRAEQITHCPQGHEYTPENTYIDGSRKCKTCISAYHKRRRIATLSSGQTDGHA